MTAVRVHAIQTGTVMVKRRQVEGVGRGARRRAATLVDREWTAPLPILCFAIEHPEGLIVVDTGATAAGTRPESLPRRHPYFRFGVRFQVAAEDELAPRMRAVGLDPADVRWTVMTHLHSDHADGLGQVAGSEVLVTRREWHDASGLRGRLAGYLNKTWPPGLSPTLVDLEPGRDHPLTAAGDIRLLATPGHTPGHLSVLVDRGADRILLAGDASYAEDQMRRGAIDGLAPDDAVAHATLERLQRLVAEAPTTYLPAHDPQSVARLRAAVEGGA